MLYNSEFLCKVPVMKVVADALERRSDVLTMHSCPLIYLHLMIHWSGCFCVRRLSHLKIAICAISIGLFSHYLLQSRKKTVHIPRKPALRDSFSGLPALGNMQI